MWEPGLPTGARMWLGAPRPEDLGPVGSDGRRKQVWPPTRGGVAVPAPDDVGWAVTSSGAKGWYVNGKNRIMIRQDVKSDTISV